LQVQTGHQHKLLGEEAEEDMIQPPNARVPALNIMADGRNQREVTMQARKEQPNCTFMVRYFEGFV